jgi:hypothetical protein
MCVPEARLDGQTTALRPRILELFQKDETRVGPFGRAKKQADEGHIGPDAVERRRLAAVWPRRRVSPAIRWCARAGPRANVAAKRGMNRRTGGTGDHVIDRRLKTGDATSLGRGRCWKHGAENNRSCNRNFCCAEHFRISPSSFAASPKLLAPTGQHTHGQGSPRKFGLPRKFAASCPNSLQVLVRACSLLA